MRAFPESSATQRTCAVAIVVLAAGLSIVADLPASSLLALLGLAMMSAWLITTIPANGQATEALAASLPRTPAVRRRRASR